MESINITELINSLKNGDTWIILLVVAIFGMIGGLAHKLVAPPEDKTRLEGYLVVGAVSSIAVLYILNPKDSLKLIALSLVAGYVGKAILDALGLRIKLAIAQEKTTEVKEKGIEAIEAGKKAQQKATDLFRYSDELTKNLVSMKQQPKKDILESMAADMPEIAFEAPENVLMDLKEIESTLNHLEKSLKK